MMVRETTIDPAHHHHHHLHEHSARDLTPTIHSKRNHNHLLVIRGIFGDNTINKGSVADDLLISFQGSWYSH